MADLAVVALGLDTTGMKRGEQEVNRTLQKISSDFDHAKAKASDLETRLNQAGSKAGQGFKATAQSTTHLGSALSGLGGPVGQIAGQIQNLVSQSSELTASFGTIGGAAIAAVAGVAALGASLIKLTLDGVKVSDQLLDIAEATGFTTDTMQRLAAGFGLAGEDIGQVERAFRQYQSTVVDANRGSKEAQQTLRDLGVDGKKAGQDINNSFLDVMQRLPEIRQGLAGMAASNAALGRGIGALTRSSEDYNRVLSATREELERTGGIATRDAIAAGAALDRQINQLSHTWTVFTQNLAASKIGDLIGGGMATANILMTDQISIIDALTNTFRAGGNAAIGFAEAMAKAATATAELAAQARRAQSAGAPSRAALFGKAGPPITPPAGAAKAPPAIQPVQTLQSLEAMNRKAKETYDAWQAVNESFYSAQLRDLTTFNNQREELDAGMREAFLQNARNTLNALQTQLATLKPGTENWKRVADEMARVNAEVLRLEKGLKVLVPPSLKEFLGALPAAPPPAIAEVTRQRRIGPHPEDILTERGPTRPRRVFEEEALRRAALEEQFSLIFEDFLFSILTARKTLGEAFGGLALGIADQFAQSFIEAMRKDFIDPVVKGLTDLLSDAIGSIFGGLKGGGGLKGVFGGILKGIGTIFGGMFEAGGVLPANQLGVVGERGPELIFSGARPLTVAPTGIGGGNAYTFNFAVTTPTGQIDRRSQDQLAASVMNAVKRAQRNQGAR